jgi:hypothetical protein
MTKILFHENQLGERGTTVAMYDYAYYLRLIYGADPIIAYNTSNKNDEDTVAKFKKEFNVLSYENFNELDKFIEKNAIPYFYAIKYGYNDGVISKSSKNLIHSVFSKSLDDVHGDRYAVVSEWQSLYSNKQIPSVPHMLNLVDTDEDLRAEYSIPSDAIVIGRHGGYDTFNIDFTVESIYTVLNTRSNVWFLFVNTERKILHERCIYIEKIIDLKQKTKFINSCDAMIHARDYGETFGLSVLEFAAKNKAIITYDNEDYQTNHPLGGRNHFLFLQDQCYKYTNKEQLDDIFLHIEKENKFNTLFLADKFSPTNVAKKFKEIFLN